jgi:ABC-type Fe3+-siderophore transport system permease subunit
LISIQTFSAAWTGLMAGALLAVVLRTKTFEPPRYGKPAWAPFLIAACLAILADNHQVRWTAFSMTSLASVSLVYVALFSPGEKDSIVLQESLPDLHY